MYKKKLLKMYVFQKVSESYEQGLIAAKNEQDANDLIKCYNEMREEEIKQKGYSYSDKLSYVREDDVLKGSFAVGDTAYIMDF